MDERAPFPCALGPCKKKKRQAREEEASFQREPDSRSIANRSPVTLRRQPSCLSLSSRTNAGGAERTGRRHHRDLFVRKSATVQLLVLVFDDFQIKFEIVCGLQLKKMAVCKTSCSKNVATGFISARFHLGGHGAPAVQPPCAGANLKDEAAAPGMPLRCRWLRASPNDAVREPCDTPSPMARWRRRLSRMYTVTLVIGLTTSQR